VRPLVKKGLIVLVVVTVVLTGTVLAMSATFPIINDVTTDPERPPVFFTAPKGKRAPALDTMSYNPGFAPMQRRSYPKVQPLLVSGEPESVCARARDVAQRRMGWSLVADDAEAGRFQAVAITKFFKFHDDVVVTCDPVAGGTEINVRSRSRVGKSDFGANAKRITAFLEELERSANREKR
jgi:uncharacterized protein (DUF1499 family)